MAKNFTIDFSEFNKKLREITKKVVVKFAEEGVAKAGMQLLNDAVMQRPTVPIKEGWLRGSGSVFVGNKLVGISSRGKKGKACTVNIKKIKPGDIDATVGFNTPYAARLHEAEGMKFTDPSSGPKYLESKMSRNKNIYFKIIANAIKKGIDC